MNYDEYRRQMTDEAGKYEDFVYTQLFHQLGVCLVPYKSRFYQINAGENGGGVEIKYDQQWATTGNLWIEIEEKAKPRNGDYVPAGIHKKELPWLYVIGDYSRIYVFATRCLQRLRLTNKYPIKENGTKTSKGFLIDTRTAELTAAAVLFPLKNIPPIGKVLIGGEERPAVVLDPPLG